MFRRATLRLSPIVRTGPGQACRRQSPLHLRFEPAIIPLSCRRTYAKETSPEEEDAAAKATELSQRAVEREERLVTSGTSAQAKENDRPWQRESSSAQPESTSPDPSKGDRSKGTPLRCLRIFWIYGCVLTLTRPAFDDTDASPQTHSTDAFPPRTRTHQ